MKWHPDKNKDNIEEANERFHEISEAYDVLVDKEKRAIYDQYGYEALHNGVPDEDGNMRAGYDFKENGNEIFNNFFGTDNPFMDFGFGDTMPFASSLRKKGPEKAKLLEVNLHCTLNDVYNGNVLESVVVRERDAQEEKTFSMKALASWVDGTRVVYEGEGHEQEDCVVGDLVFVVKIKEHAQFTRKGNDLVFLASIKLVDALTDCVVQVPTLDGRKLPITCNEVISPESEKVIPQEGMKLANGQVGDLSIQFKIIFPKHLTAQQKKALVQVL